MKKFLFIAIFSILIPLSFSHGDTITWANGDTYTGDVKNGLPHGQGTLTWTNGARYSGEWKDFKYHGQGTFTYSDGSIYSCLSYTSDAADD